LLDRLAKQRLVRRRRDVRDRRAVLTEITDEGRQLVNSVIPSLDCRVRELFEHMEPARLQLLIELLDEAIEPQKQRDRAPHLYQRREPTELRRNGRDAAGRGVPFQTSFEV
jgi:DNA-binding PadR family transcriptional regulator